MKYLNAYASETTMEPVKWYPHLSLIRDTSTVYGTGSYIRNGLVFMLDGINKGAISGSWTDLIGQISFSNNGCTSISNGWQISNNSSSNSLRNTSTLSFPQASCTIEVCYNSTNATGLFFAPMGSSNIALGLVANKRFIWNNTSAAEWTSSTVSTTGAHTVSINATYGLMDRTIQLVKGNSNSWLQGNYNGIGARSTNNTYSFSGSIFAIRIYNRQLSYDEMQYNQKEDQKRFLNN